MKQFFLTKLEMDKPLLGIIGILLMGGVLIFASASLGLLARGNNNVTSMVTNHILFGVVAGLIVLFITSRINYVVWKEYAWYFFGASAILTALVFVPHVGLHVMGASRWIAIGGFSLQPSEFLKIGTLFALAAYFTRYRTRLNDIRYGLGGFAAIMAVPMAILLAQPDNGTLGIIVLSGGAMFVAAGARLRHIALGALAGLLLLGVVVAFRPYALERITTFLNPSHDHLDTGYQLRQSLIAIGSGGLTGRGFGQSIQKFNYLPEPVSDSIFAVASEEFGMIGSLLIIAAYVAFAGRGFFVASRTPDYFGALLAVGITTYIVAQAFINIASMLGVIPLTGVPLVFISHGGTAMLTALGATGILLAISRRAQGT